MRVACVRTHGESVANPADVFVFPEGSTSDALWRTASLFPNSIVVGAYEEPMRERYRRLTFCRAAVLRGGFQWRNQVDYLKIGTDGHGRTQGIERPPPFPPVYEVANLCVGVLICMDVNAWPFAREVVERVRASAAEVKLICVPADMGQPWFSSGVGRNFEGVHLAVCNSVRAYRGNERCKSFIATPDLAKAAVQTDEEPIWLDVPGASLCDRAHARLRAHMQRVSRQKRSLSRASPGSRTPLI